MRFKDKYTNSDKEKNKKELSDDAYAIGELLNNILGELQRRGMKW